MFYVSHSSTQKLTSFSTNWLQILILCFLSETQFFVHKCFIFWCSIIHLKNDKRYPIYVKIVFYLKIVFNRQNF